MRWVALDTPCVPHRAQRAKFGSRPRRGIFSDAEILSGVGAENLQGGQLADASACLRRAFRALGLAFGSFRVAH